VNLSELNDWSYICNGVMEGGFTVKALEQISSDKPRS
jgi:uncharacterized protein YegJ (DUF2314 family)